MRCTYDSWKNHLWKSLEQLSNETRRLIRDQTEIIGMKTSDLKELTWRSTSLLRSRANQITNAKTYIFSDSVVCVEKDARWSECILERQIKWYSENNHWKELSRIVGMQTEVEWKIFPGFTINGHPRRDSKILWMIYIVNLSSSSTGSSSCQCTTTLCGEKKEIRKIVFKIPLQLRNTLADSLAVVGLSWDLDQKRNGMGPLLINQTEIGTEMMMLQLHTETGHPTFRASSAFERGELRSKGHGKKSVHFNGSEENIELLLRTVVSASQLSVYGAMADVHRISQRFRKLGETESTWSFGDHANSCCHPHHRTATGKPGARLWAQTRTIVWWPEVIQTLLWRWFEVCRKRTILLHTWYRRRRQDATFMPRIHNASIRKEDSSERMDSQACDNWSSLGHTSLSSGRPIQYWSSGRISVSRPNSLLGSNRERNWQVCDRIDGDQEEGRA